MHNPTIRVPSDLDGSRHGKNVHETITNLRFLLGEALTDEVALEIQNLVSRSFSAGWIKGAAETEYDRDY